MYDGKKGIASKIVYDAIDKIKTKSKEDPINVFNEAINNIKPTVELDLEELVEQLIKCQSKLKIKEHKL